MLTVKETKKGMEIGEEVIQCQTLQKGWKELGPQEANGLRDTEVISHLQESLFSRAVGM